MDRRALIVSYYFPPVGGGGVQRMAKLVKFATRRGWQFTVVTAREPAQIIPQDSALLKEIPPQTKIVTVDFPLPGGKSVYKINTAGYFKRWLSAFLFLPDSRRAWVKRAWPAVSELLKKERFDLVLVTIPPYSLSFLAAKIQKFTSVPVVLDLRDPWTLNPYKIHPTPLHRYLDWQYEKRMVSNTQLGISAYHKVLDYYAKKIPAFESSKWTVIPNGFDEEDFEGLGSAAPSKYFTIGFSGTIYSHLNHPTPLFKAMARAIRQNPKLKERLRFLHVGKAHIDLPALACRFGIEKLVQTMGYLEHRKSLRILNEASVLCFILDDRDARSKFTVGGKVYEYLRLKKPILALVPEDGEAAELIKKTQSGVVISPQRVEWIVQTLLSWEQNLPELTFSNIEEFNREKQAEQFLQVFERLQRPLR